MEGGNVYLALGRYNGSRGRPEYPNAVLSAWKKWEFNTSQAANAMPAGAIQLGKR
jgi:soluble lytic murein transglycosylase-like protein